MTELRPLTLSERQGALDPDAWTSSPLPEGCDGSIICECRFCYSLTVENEDPSDHDLDCACIYCIPGA